MTVTIPTLVGRARQAATYTTQSDILAGDWTTLAETAHYLYAHAGARSTGITESDSTSSDTLVLYGTFHDDVRLRPHRLVASDFYRFEVWVHGRQYTFAADVLDQSGNTIDQTTFSNDTTTHQWNKGTLGWDTNNSSSTFDLVEFKLQFSTSLNESPAEINAVGIDEKIDLPASELPDTTFTT